MWRSSRALFFPQRGTDRCIWFVRVPERSIALIQVNGICTALGTSKQADPILPLTAGVLIEELIFL